MILRICDYVALSIGAWLIVAMLATLAGGMQVLIDSYEDGLTVDCNIYDDGEEGFTHGAASLDCVIASSLWMCLSQGRTGHMPYHSPQGMAFVWGVETYEEYRRRGLARIAMTTVIEKARAHNESMVGLYVNPTNDPAIRLYESLGFTWNTAATPSRYNGMNLMTLELKESA